LQKILSFFGIGPRNQPTNAEEAQQYANRMDEITSRNQVLNNNMRSLQEKADWIPFVGAAMHLSSGMVNHDDKEAGLGIGLGLVDGVGGELIGKGGKLIAGAGKDILEGVVKKVGNIGEHLTEKDVTGAIRDIFKDPVVINGKTYDHLGEVNDALKGLGNQIEGLNKAIKKGTFSDDVLTQAKKLRSTLQKEKDRIQNILNKANKAANE
jgi:polyhydroxyalkanoate synthesis regulator phasin